MKTKVLLFLACFLIISYVPACTKVTEPHQDDSQTEQPEEKPENENSEGDNSKPNPDPETPENPDPDKPENPDLDKPETPDPENPEAPDPEIPETPDPENPEAPDPDDNGPEPGKSTSVAFDFTGQYCMYCPNMTRSLEEKQKQYPGHYIIIALHSDLSYSPDLYQSEAEAYHKNMIAEGTLHEGFPNNIFNSLGSYMEEMDIDKYINSPSLFKLDGSVRMEGRKLTADLKADICKGQSSRFQGKECIVMLWLTENGVIAKQSDTSAPGGWNMKYNHKFLFRKSLNGLWGESYVPGEVYTFSVLLPENVVVDNSQIVMLILDKKTKETLAAAEYPLKK